jgi:hypothetical protein
VLTFTTLLQEMEVSDDIDDEELEDDNDDGSSESEEEDSDDSDRPRKHRPFVPPPPREALPVRTTRGKNLGAIAAVQDDQADEEFWNQEFFAEEEADEIYATESEPEDNFDADFMESVRSFFFLMFLFSWRDRIILDC